MPWRQQAPPVGQHPVGAAVQLEHVVKVPGVGLDRAGVGGELAEPQELGLGRLGQGLGIMHGHGGRQVPEVTLHHVDRHPGVEQAGGGGMPEAVGAVEIDQRAGVVADPEAGGQPGQQAAQGAVGVGPVAVAVHVRGEEQVLRPGAGRAAGCGVRCRPLLLLPDDRDDLVVDEDGARCAVDLGLLVAELGDRGLPVLPPVRPWFPGQGKQRQQRIGVQHADLVDAPAQEGCQQGNPHGLLVAVAAVAGGLAQQAGSGHDLRHRRRADDLALQRRPVRHGKLAAPVEPVVLGSQRQPAGLGQRGGRVVLAVGHVRVELLDVAGQARDRRGGQRLPGPAPPAGRAGAQPGEELEHERAHRGGPAGQRGAADLAAGQERVEFPDGADPAVHARPGQRSCFQAGLAVPLRADPQPPGGDLAEPHRVTPHRLVLAQRDPAVPDGIPVFPPPPRPGIQGDGQESGHAGQQAAQVPYRRRGGKLPGAAMHRVRDLPGPLRHREAQQRDGHLAAAPGGDLADPSGQHVHGRHGDRAADLDDPEQAPGHLLAHPAGQRRQVDLLPGTAVADRAGIPRRDGRWGKPRLPHRPGHRCLQRRQRRPVPASVRAGSGLPVPAVHEGVPG